MSEASLDPALREAALAWIAQDPDPETRAELDALLQQADAGEPGAIAELQDRFAGRLTFGTAGLRAALGAGPRRMNRVVVGQAALGLAAWLHQHVAAQPIRSTPSVVIGYDARKNSHQFALDSAELLAGAGIEVTLLPAALPTPVLAQSVRSLGVTAGIMVTASHNPAADNGYKVYLGGESGGAQIVPPVDAEIAACIAEAATRPLDGAPRSKEFQRAADSLVYGYISTTASLALPDGMPPMDLRGLPAWVYTPLHGVGGAIFLHVLETVGARPPILVAEQMQPDPDFPTVAFPNPEEAGALDLAMTTADANGADLILAHDPDADRLAVAVRGAAGWERLTGNELGTLLAWEVAEQLRATGRTGTMATTLVSSPALATIAAEYGLDFAETPTGFKWIGRVPNLVFGYEEALGYLVDPHNLSDKDGISAAVIALGLFARLHAQGKTLEEHRAEFAARFGRFSSHQHSLRLPVPQIGAAMAALRATPPASLGGLAIESAVDLSVDTDRIGGGVNILRYVLADGTRVQLRPSGTEPKLKVYLDRGPNPDAAALPLPDLALRVAEDVLAASEAS